MKKLIVFLALVTITGLLSNIVAQQSNYYYYQKQKQPLEINTQYIYLLVQGKPSEINTGNLQIQNTSATLLSTENANTLLGVNTSEVYEMEIPVANTTTIQEYNNLLQGLKVQNKVLAVMPYFKTSTYNKVRLSNMVFVKLKSPSDASLLASKAQELGAQIHEQNKFMPLWYTLLVPIQGKYNALDIANILQESGLFEYAEPDFIVKDEKKKKK